MKAETTIKIPRWVNIILWRLGAKRRKYILQFFGLWTIEDEIFEILSDEIRKEIDAEIIARVKVNNDEME